MHFSYMFAAAVAFANAAIAAQPPACYIGVLAEQPNPADIKKLCGDLQKAMLGNLTEICQSDDLEDAYGAYKSGCKGVNVDVASLSKDKDDKDGDKSKDDEDKGKNNEEGSGIKSSSSKESSSSQHEEDTGTDNSSDAATESQPADSEPTGAASGFVPPLSALVAGLAASSLFL